MQNFNYLIKHGSADALRQHFDKDNVNVSIGGVMPLAIAAMCKTASAEKVEILVGLGANPAVPINGPGTPLVQEVFTKKLSKVLDGEELKENEAKIFQLLHTACHVTVKNCSDLFLTDDQ